MPMLSNNFQRTVLLVEDDAEIRNSYQLLINNSGHYKVIGAVGKGEDAVDCILKLQPDIVLMDIELPGINGIETTRLIKEKLRHTEVIVLSVYEDSAYVFEALKAGASGYITKSAGYQELLHALDEIVKGGAPMSTQIARLVVDTFHTNPATPLSRRETEVLNEIAGGKSHSQIAEELFVSKETIKTHVKNIYSKLNANSKAEALEVARKNKYIR